MVKLQGADRTGVQEKIIVEPAPPVNQPQQVIFHQSLSVKEKT